MNSTLTRAVYSANQLLLIGVAFAVKLSLKLRAQSHFSMLPHLQILGIKCQSR